MCKNTLGAGTILKEERFMAKTTLDNELRTAVCCSLGSLGSLCVVSPALITTIRAPVPDFDDADETLCCVNLTAAWRGSAVSQRAAGHQHLPQNGPSRAARLRAGGR